MSSMAQRLREDAQRHCQGQQQHQQPKNPSPPQNPFGASQYVGAPTATAQTTTFPQGNFAAGQPPMSMQPQQQTSMQPQQQMGMQPHQYQQMPQQNLQHQQAGMSMMTTTQPTNMPMQQHQGVITTSSTVDVSQVRNDWRKHGVNLSQALEDVRNSRNPCHLRVKVLSAVERQDAIDQPYTAYIIHLMNQNVQIERRYSDFLKFKESANIQISIPFPSKSTVFYKRKEAIIADRVKQLDAWLVHAVVEYNHGRIRDDMGFLNPCPLPLPFQRFEPDADLLGLKAVVTILQTTVIPVDLWRTSFGLFVYTSFVPSLRGILLARRPQNSWAAPIAIQTIGVCRSSVVIITKESLIRDVCHGTRLDLGATQDALVAIGNTELLTSVVTSVRANVNAKFYGKKVPALDLLQTDGPTHIPAARMVYEALNQVQLSG